MPLRLACDGCDATVPQDDAIERGRLNKVFYCPACAAKYDLVMKEIAAERVRSVAAFDTYRKAMFEDLATKLERIPDA